MTKKYVDEQNLQVTMTEYNDIDLGREVKDQYDRPVGTVAQVYDNTNGNGEQVYAVVPDPKQVLEWGMV